MSNVTAIPGHAIVLTGAFGGEDYLVSLLFTGWNRFVFSFVW
jgi:hypothetical protein